MTDRIDEILSISRSVAANQLEHQAEIIQLASRIDRLEQDNRKAKNSTFPRVQRSVTESVHEHDTEMAAVAVFMGEHARSLAELKEQGEANAAKLAAQADVIARKATRRTWTLGGVLTLVLPFAVRIYETWMTARHL